MLFKRMALRFDLDVRALRAIRKIVRGLILSRGGSEEDALAFEIATGEVLKNAHEHAYARQSGPVEINLLCDESRVELTLHNHGTRLTGVPVIPSAPPSGSRGRGLYIARQLTDECEVIRASNGRGGIGIRLLKYLRRDRTNGKGAKTAPAGGQGRILEPADCEPDWELR